jgi:hypothetical protein
MSNSFYWFLGVFLGVFLSACSSDKSDAPPVESPPNAPPAFTSGSQFSVDENHKNTVLTLTATDPNSDALRFSLEGTDAQWFTLGAHTGVLEFVEPPDFETPHDQNSDNLYEFNAIVRDGRGGQVSQGISVQVNNLTFAFEVLSPRPGMLLELERYSRIPLAVRLEYDYPERLQILCNGEILNPASDSRATWTGSLAIAPGEVDVNMVFERGGQVIATHVVPVRHQHLISAHDHLIYDGANDSAVIPHPERLETLVIDLENNRSRKLYPWSGQVPDIKDFVFDPNTSTSLFNSGGLYRLDSSDGSVTPVSSDLETTLAAEQQSALALDTAGNRLFVAGDNHQYAQVNLNTGATQIFNHSSGLPEQVPGNVQLAYDNTQNRLLVAQENATGVDALTPGESAPTASFAPSWMHRQRFGEVALDNSRNTLFLSGFSGHGLAGLDLDSGAYSQISGANLVAPEAAAKGTGPALYTPNTLALDTNRDRLLTSSASRLLAVDPDTGNRSMIFDSSVGSGDLTGGFAGIWVAPDGARAIALDRELLRYYDIDLRTGEKTAKSYETQLLSQVDYRVQGAKINADGSLAIIHYRSRDAAVVGEEYLDLVDLETGSNKRLRRGESQLFHVDFIFSQPNDQLLLLVRDGENYALWFYSLEQGDFAQRQNLSLALGFTPLALQRVNEKIYVLGRAEVNATPLFQLYELNNEFQLNLLFGFEDKGDGKNSDADINVLYHQTQLVLVLPEQEPKFWNIAEQSEATPAFTEFQGTDQARDFYSIDDFEEFYYFRANAGLHLCWRYNCGVLAN